MNTRRYRVTVNGRVQGVGFRPFVYRLASEAQLTGWVNNNSEGVCIEVEGEQSSLTQFLTRLREETPPLAQIVHFHQQEMATQAEPEFCIHDSERGERANTLIPPDAATCVDCLGELFDPANRRFHYPFTNCTNCGPRFTIVAGIPYDRPLTSMACFPLCAECRSEYDDPGDRRFHAQPNACAKCGPQIRLCDGAGKQWPDPLAKLVEMLAAGAVAAVRGLGGFHLVVDAKNQKAVKALRARKGREEKPFALMAPDLDAVRRFCRVDAEEGRLLQEPCHPIVLLDALPKHGLAASIAPASTRLGFMLPYTPLHHLLLRDNFDALVMTSGNLSEEPVITSNEDALERLNGLADIFLLHNREILQPCDDSIVQRVAGQTQIIRRARGFVPLPIFLTQPLPEPILACGGQFKNVFALSRGAEVFSSQHIGDMDQVATFQFFKRSIDHFMQVLEVSPMLAVCDRHPRYIASAWARGQSGLPVFEVYHHHAHLASVMAENGVDQPCIGIILDGSGYGPGDAIWGGEVLVGGLADFERFAWLQPMMLPGSAMAIRQPWRLALAALFLAFGPDAEQMDLPFMADLQPQDRTLIFRLMEKDLNCPSTSSAGRLFDAASALLGLCTHTSYEAQAAMYLEAAVDPAETGSYPVDPDPSSGPLDTVTLIRALVDDIGAGLPQGVIASRFHRSLAALFVGAARAARQQSQINTVALSGGVFQNRTFTTLLIQALRRSAFDVLTHTKVPCNDGGLALGQIAIADAWLRMGRTPESR